jgi:exo-beta-1,3-glucanase (GH17 family)
VRSCSALWLRGSVFLLILLLWPAASATARALPGGQIASLLKTVRFVAYTPRGFSVVNGATRGATATGIRQDLTLLRPYFDGLITYSVTDGHDRIPAAAQELGFRALILGIWDPTRRAERDIAIRLARAYPELVLGVAAGNEGLHWKRYDWPRLRAAMDHLRAALPAVAITTSEPFALYLDDPPDGFADTQDLLLPNVHPLFEAWFRPAATEQAARFVANVAARLRERYTQPLLIKETGLPSGPGRLGFDEARQAVFWRTLGRQIPAAPGVAFAWFEAFDAPWKPATLPEGASALRAVEAHWGLFDTAGRPKAALPAALGPQSGESRGSPRATDAP